VWSGLPAHRKFALENQDGIISDCHNTLDYINTHFTARGKKQVVWDPVDLKRFEPRPKKPDLLMRFNIPCSEKTRFLMTLCRLSVGSRHKGVERILQVMRKLEDMEDIHYIIAGDGNDRGRLESLSREMGISHRTHFIGNVNESELVDVYNLGDLFVLISDIGEGRGEGIPMTPMEAGACGKPLLVGNQDGSRELINSGEGGYILAPFDLEGTEKAIRTIFSDQRLYAELSEQIRRRVASHFSYEAFSHKTISALEGCNE
jgi:phosphatidylinositol alpha-1,6-mannosyltransferase